MCTLNAINVNLLSSRKWKLIFLYLSLYCVCFVHGGPIITKNGSAITSVPSTKAFDFMKRFGYLASDEPNSAALYSDEAISKAIKMVQKYGAIPQTGIIDNATLTLMSSRRCGVADIYKKEHRHKRFVVGATGWKKRNISYFVANWHHNIGEQGVVENIKKALNVWAGYGNLAFRYVRDPAADIIIAFGSGYHGDNYPFDGQGNILAHAYYPYENGYVGGDIHFDNDEHWTTDTTTNPDGVDFFTVALHELGHSLGLAHSHVPSSIMFPYYNGNSIQLDYDDILGMFELYIKRVLEEDLIERYSYEEKTEVPEPTTPSYSGEFDHNGVNEDDVPNKKPVEHPTGTTTEQNVASTQTYPTYTFEGDYETVDDHIRRFGKMNESNVPDICNGNFDAIGVFRGELFIFKDLYVWRLKKLATIEEGYPARIHYFFRGLPDSVTKIDAAYERYDAHIILFTGNQYWVYDGSKFVDGSPRPITDYNLPPYTPRIDAAQIWYKNKKLYLYSGNLFWRYNEISKTVDPGYPLEITKRWRGVPNNLDAAVTWIDTYTYFFKNDMYWRFDNIFIKTVDSYPLPAPQVWLGCPEGPENVWWKVNK